MSIKARVRIKMCGMTQPQDVHHAAMLGVDAIGVILYDKSPRGLSVENAHTVLADVPLFLTVVGVFVNPTPADVETAIHTLPLHVLQFHGEEDASFCEQFGLPYIKAIHADALADLAPIVKTYARASALLIDTPCSEQRGGSGKPFEWQPLKGQGNMPVILAGGLNACNVARAVSIMHPFAVDVCSGVEAHLGKKDVHQMTDFVHALRGC